jgi:hypothetical protein
LTGKAIPITAVLRLSLRRRVKKACSFKFQHERGF